MKIVKSLMRSMMFAMAMLPLLAMADVVLPELSHIETTTYVHRLHRIGYELLKDECDSLGAVDCVSAQWNGMVNYDLTLWFVTVAVLVGLALTVRRTIVRLLCKLFMKCQSPVVWRCAVWLGVVVGVAICGVCVVRYGFLEEILGNVNVAVAARDSWEVRDVHKIEHLNEDGWCFSDEVPKRWLDSCVSAVERIRKPLKRHMHIAPDSWNNTQTSEVIEALKSAPSLLKESKGIAIEVLVAAVRAADKDTDYLKNIGKEVRSERIIDRERHNPNYGRCSKCGREGYMPTHRCDAGDKTSDLL